eukprot:6980274-Prymnesium_polylepis.1
MEEVDVLIPVDDEAVAWRRAKLLQHLPGGVALVQLGDAQREVKADGIVPAGSVDDADDLASLPHLSEPQLLHALASRFDRGTIYTACGPSLLAVNPWRPLPLYTDGHLQRYREVARGGRHAADEPPHVYGVAAAALLALAREGSDQTIVVSGESGAGKSESARLLMQALVGCTAVRAPAAGDGAAGGTSSAAGLGDALLLATEVLEPFGSAQTRRNPHSSRFGRMMSLSVERSGSHARGEPKITAACVECYLLERSRVTHAPGGERLYHVFYQLLAGTS